MGGLGSGGRNKSHRTIGNYSRLDSVALRHCICDWDEEDDCDFLPRLFAGGAIFCDALTGAVDIRWGDQYRPLKLDRVRGVDGNLSRLYFLCPHCGRRVRYLYQFHEYYVCRQCLGANYESQQRNRGLEDIRRRMRKVIEKDMGYTWWRRDNPNDTIADLYIIPKPRYMRWAKYSRLMQKYRQLQDDYTREWLKIFDPFLTRDMKAEWHKYL